MEARATYEQGRDLRSREAALLEDRARVIGTARLALAVIALVLIGAFVWGHLGWTSWVLAGDIVAFLGLVAMHARVHEAKERASAALRFHLRGLARLDHKWDALSSTSARFQAADHPFTGDLDIFGHGSLMQLVDATETRFGEERLAKLLSQEGPGAWPEDVLARQEAVRDLAGRPGFREALATSGGVLADEKPDPAPLLRWAEGRGGIAPATRLLGWGLPLVTLAVIVLGSVVGLRPGVVALVIVVAIAFGIAIGVRLTPMLSAASARESSVTRWRSMIAAIEAEPFEAPLLRKLQERLSAGKRKASEEIAALERIVGVVDARRNEVFRLLIGPLLMWDVHCAFALLAWRARAGEHVRAWLDALGEVEALASLAGFAFEHPAFAWPELAAGPLLDARTLGHPLLPEDRRVGNDVRLALAGRALVVTGSNMSGKSTLLRALGINAVLAFAGLPSAPRPCASGRPGWPRACASRIRSRRGSRTSTRSSVASSASSTGRTKRASRRSCSFSTRSSTAPTRASASSGPARSFASSSGARRWEPCRRTISASRRWSASSSVRWRTCTSRSKWRGRR